LPVVQQDWARLVAIAQRVAACPAVKVAADLALAVIAVAPEHAGRAKDLAGLQAVVRVVRVHAAERAEPAVFDFEGELKTAGVCESAAVEFAGIFRRRASEREHE